MTTDYNSLHISRQLSKVSGNSIQSAAEVYLKYVMLVIEKLSFSTFTENEGCASAAETDFFRKPEMTLSKTMRVAC